MNRFITILGFSLAVSAFVNIFTKDIKIIVGSAILAFLISCFLFFLEGFFRRQKSLIVNFIAYLFQKTKRGCIVEEHQCYYERLDMYKWQFSKKYRLKSKNNTFDHFDDRFCWSSDSSRAKITPSEAGQEITGIRGQQIWTVYTTKFHTVPRGNTINTGSIISNLIDSTCSVRPFLSVTVLPKTRLLRIAVKIPAEFGPINPTLEIHSSSGMDSLISSQPLTYNEITQEIEMPPVRFPRFNWRYVIIWDYQA